jgi:uncharacterized protein YceH (UPF0502 family)
MTPHMLRLMEALSPEELRVLGCLIQKSATTPDAYPLTMNGLLSACNQTSNRTPVVSYDESTVSEAFLKLRERKLARVVHSSHGSRVPKYRHAVDELWAITTAELALLAVLALRGPQTVNEMETRTERYDADFADLGGVEGVLERLAGRDDPLVVRMGRQAGQREERWAHLLAGEPAAWAPTMTGASGRSTGWAPPGRLDDLEDEVRRLRDEVDALRTEVDRLMGELGMGDA